MPNKQNKPKLSYFKEKLGLVDLDPEISKKRISVRKELKEIVKQSKTSDNIIKGLILSPFLSYFNEIFVVLFDAMPLLDMNVTNKFVLLTVHAIKIIISLLIIILAFYSIKKGIKYQPIRLLFMIILLVINMFIIGGVLTNKISKATDLSKINKLGFADYLSIIGTAASEIITIGFLGYSLYQYFILKLRFVDHNMFIIIAKMILSIIFSIVTMVPR